MQYRLGVRPGRNGFLKWVHSIVPLRTMEIASTKQKQENIHVFQFFFESLTQYF